jgi:hypothetical protein
MSQEATPSKKAAVVSVTTVATQHNKVAAPVVPATAPKVKAAPITINATSPGKH